MDRHAPLRADARGWRGARACGRTSGGGAWRRARRRRCAARARRRAARDLILRDLKTGSELTIGNVSEFGFNKSGRYLAMVIDAADQIGNGIQIRDMQTGVIMPLETNTAFYERHVVDGRRRRADSVQGQGG